MNEKIYNQALQDFTKFSLEDKKDNLLKLIDAFGNTHPVFWEIKEDIETRTYTDKQYIDIYQIVLKSMYEMKKEWVNAGIERIQKLHNFLMELKTKEEDENKKEGDVDLRLEKVLSLLQ